MRKLQRIALICCLCLAVYTAPTYAQIYSVPIGTVIDSMPNGYHLPDGTIIYAEKIALGTGINSINYVGFGVSGDNDDFGGHFNGINNTSNTSTGTAGLTLAGYTGSADPLAFTHLRGNRWNLDSGDLTDYRNGIGFHIWFSEKTPIHQLLMIDCSGNGTPSVTDQEWLSCFGYTDNLLVKPTLVTSGANSRVIVQDMTVSPDWYNNLVQPSIPGAASFSTMPIALNNYVSTNTTSGNLDPDDEVGQVMADFGTTGINDFFVLWGVRGDLHNHGGGAQNSGLSPLVFEFNYDYGDAPASYDAAAPARHIIDSSITLGATITAENASKPGSMANLDEDDGATPHKLVAFELNNSLSIPINSYSITTGFINKTGDTARLAAWLDWNNNGSFEASEMADAIKSSTVNSNALQTVTFTWSNRTLVRTALTDTTTFARIRLTTDTITASTTQGTLRDGEVEDYMITLTNTFPLSVDIISFAARKLSNGTELNWVVAKQQDVKQYEVLRSGNGTDFKVIGTVTPSGNPGETTYSLTDDHPVSGNNYYRLRVVNLDGTVGHYSQTLLVNYATMATQCAIYPNPANNFIKVETTGSNHLIKATIYNTQGQVALAGKQTGDGNRIDISCLPAGNYMLHLVLENGETLVKKILIAR